MLNKAAVSHAAIAHNANHNAILIELTKPSNTARNGTQFTTIFAIQIINTEASIKPQANTTAAESQTASTAQYT